ncbi:hypothetical protein OSB04_008257 [Centaurea solstitialis]|uniref:non-specific serine/threonine protein kinase n=1 Tax=Centaurea solstitialis TaxID=347529 RepID=A0AA38U4Q0_9ASTR|nr:hypothetical protein OSB04_008257 [Centaurea solstitialis]
MFFVEEFRHLKLQLEDIISATDNFNPNKLIGHGGFGKVYKGELSLSEKPCMVAFKRLDSKFGQGNTESWKEIMMLSKYKHKNLVTLLHFCFEGDERILVYEYASRGSLDRYLNDVSLTWIQRLKICVGVARGLNYLHDPMETKQRVLHRDIKSSNILLDEKWNAKVSDFGLSKVGPANQPQTYLVSNVVGTIGYCDPSYFETGLLSKESDVYSLGVVLFEVMCGKLCCEYRNGEIICILVPIWKKCFEENRLDDIIFPDIKEQIQHDSLMTFSTIANQCLQRDHKKRPTMVEIVQQLEVAIEQQLGIDITEESDEIKHIGAKLQPTMFETTNVRGMVRQTTPRKFDATTMEESSSGHGNGGQERWWEYYNSDECPDEDFKKAFRMSKSTFNIICHELVGAMLQLAIPVRQRVAVCLYRLATGDPLETVSTRVGLGILTCHGLVLEVCSAIKKVLMPKFLHWPYRERLEETKTKFLSISGGIPNVCGSIYTTHISIIAPEVRQAAYFNKKHTKRNQKPSYSTTIQGVVDSLGVFTDVCVGYPGSMSNDKILEKSTLSERFNMGYLKNIWVVGNSGYPLLDWLLVPYTHPNLTSTQHSFNGKIKDMQKIAKDAFMRLKGRWTCLQKQMEVKPQDLPVVLEACCVLHNICEINGEAMDADLRFDLFDDEVPVKENRGGKSVTAVQARDSIAHNLLHLTPNK